MCMQVQKFNNLDNHGIFLQLHVCSIRIAFCLCACPCQTVSTRVCNLIIFQAQSTLACTSHRCYDVFRIVHQKKKIQLRELISSTKRRKLFNIQTRCALIYCLCLNFSTQRKCVIEKLQIKQRMKILLTFFFCG